ncbi:hypothetical protein PISL3812_02623 [Talaromyces islandicus]|uniref:Hydroxylase cctR n=1 Tax=Talaromyces islandicus TaxID=28573 RepID=CCTR_TALIS|nr:RecName: Full=Hydroxylase cctR; AltName: Full=Cyclochlorotine biosynthesis protein R [Talaromyces islandicus]CRG85576.1 hypothetical protein PISL3812_02623 [Talaromyces islandicus]
MEEELEPLNRPTLDPDESYAEEKIYGSSHREPNSRIRVFVSLLILSNTISFGLLGWIGLSSTQASLAIPEDYAIPPRIATQYKRFWWTTEYSSKNQSQQDELWNSIVWTYGMIGVDHEWSKSQHWPDTMSLPQDKTKAVYLLQAYHEIHCLGVLRRLMSQSLAGVDFSESEHTHAHIAHCFDSLLQSTICRADSTPLYTFGGTIVGSGQQHECRDWNALRDYATQNSACYTEESGFGGQCSDGDGLVPATPMETQQDGFWL